MTKTKAIRMPGKERPAASRLVIQKPPTTKPHLRNLAKKTKPSADQLIKPIAEGLEYRFLGASPVSSALDHFTGRDPGKARTNIACQLGCFATWTKTPTPRRTLLTLDAEE
jgi:hypothetical protein